MLTQIRIAVAALVLAIAAFTSSPASAWGGQVYGCAEVQFGANGVVNEARAFNVYHVANVQAAANALMAACLNSEQFCLQRKLNALVYGPAPTIWYRIDYLPFAANAAWRINCVY